MRYLILGEIFELHRLVAETSGGATGIRDLAALESAVAQPKATFDMIDLFRLFRVTRLLMATSELVMPRCQLSSYSTAQISMPRLTNKSDSRCT